MSVSVTPVSEKLVTVTVNGTTYEHEVPARRLLVHFLRDDLALTGTHVGCDTGAAGRARCTSTASPSRAALCSRSRPTAPDHDGRGARAKTS